MLCFGFRVIVLVWAILKQLAKVMLIAAVDSLHHLCFKLKNEVLFMGVWDYCWVGGMSCMSPNGPKQIQT